MIEKNFVAFAHVLFFFEGAADFFGRGIGAEVVEVTIVFIGPCGTELELIGAGLIVVRLRLTINRIRRAQGSWSAS